MNNSSNQQNSPAVTIGVFIYIAIATTLYLSTDKMFLSMVGGAGIMAIGALIVLFVSALWKKADKKKLNIVGIILAVVVFSSLIIMGIADASIPTLSKGEVEAMVLQQLEPQLEKVRTELGISDLSVEITLDDYEYRRPTLFDKGRISFDVTECYLSNSFTDLENEAYTQETCDKYNDIDRPDYDDIEFSRYYVSIDSGYGSAEFKDSKGNIYSFSYNKITKNDISVYQKTYTVSSNKNSSSSSSSYSSSSKCPNCNGSGYVRYYAGLYDEGTVGPCPMCN